MDCAARLGLVAVDTITTIARPLQFVGRRFRADKGHEVFKEMLEGITAEKEVLELYREIKADYFRKNDSNKSRRAKEIQAQLDKLKQRLQNAQSLMLDAEINASEYRDIRNVPTAEIESLERRRFACLTSEDDYSQYLK